MHMAQQDFSGRVLYRHTKHGNPDFPDAQPKNANELHNQELDKANFNGKVALRLTKVFQAMPTFWLIMAWFFVWIAGNFTLFHFDMLPWPLLLCLASIPQLPLMIVIMVGQGLLGRKQEHQADEQFKFATSTYQDVEEIKEHLGKQSAEMVSFADGEGLRFIGINEKLERMLVACDQFIREQREQTKMLQEAHVNAADMSLVLQRTNAKLDKLQDESLAQIKLLNETIERIMDSRCFQKGTSEQMNALEASFERLSSTVTETLQQPQKPSLLTELFTLASTAKQEQGTQGTQGTIVKPPVTKQGKNKLT